MFHLIRFRLVLFGKMSKREIILAKTKKILQEAGKLKRSIDKKNNFAVLYDTDPDGLCAAIITVKSLIKLGKKVSFIRGLSHSNGELWRVYNKNLKNTQIDCLISCDLSLDQFKTEVKKISKHIPIIILDHHKLYNSIQSKEILLVKPQLFQKKIEPSQYCSSKLVFDIFSELCDIKELDWLASIGIIADSNFRTWKKFVNKTLVKYGLKAQKDPFQSELGKISNLIAYSEIYSENNDKKVFKIIYDIYDASDFSKLMKKFKKFEVVGKEIEKQLKTAENKIETYKDLLLLEIKSRFKIGSIISTKLSANKYWNKTVVVVQELGKKRIFISARRQDYRIAVNDLLEKSTKNIKNSSAGGHIPAAGASIPKNKYTMFKNALIALNWKMHDLAVT